LEHLVFNGANNLNVMNVSLAGGTLEFTQSLVNRSGAAITGRGTLISSSAFPGGRTWQFGAIEGTVLGFCFQRRRKQSHELAEDFSLVEKPGKPINRVSSLKTNSVTGLLLAVTLLAAIG